MSGPGSYSTASAALLFFAERADAERSEVLGVRGDSPRGRRSNETKQRFQESGILKSVHRVLVRTAEEDKVLLLEEEAHHLVKVLRARIGDEFLGYDGNGSVYLCRLRREADGWYGQVVERRDGEAESPLSVCLAQSLIKKDKFEWVIQKAVELGVQEIVPIIAWRTEVRPDEEGIDRKMRRWEKIMAEALKQSGRCQLPKLNPPVRLEDFLNRWHTELRFVLDEGGGISLRQLLHQHRDIRSCQFLIGPEGGWDDRDRAKWADHGVVPVQLGRRILRTETCPITVLSILQYELGDL